MNPVSPRGRAFPSRDLRSPQGGLERGAVAAAALSAGLAGLWLSGRSLSESNPSRAGKPDDLTLKTSLLLLLLFLKGGTFAIAPGNESKGLTQPTGLGAHGPFPGTALPVRCPDGRAAGPTRVTLPAAQRRLMRDLLSPCSAPRGL